MFRRLLLWQSTLLKCYRYAPLTEKLKELVDKAHGPQDWERQSLLIGSGGQESMCNAIEMCLNEGDTVIIPQPVYPGTADIVSTPAACLIHAAFVLSFTLPSSAPLLIAFPPERYSCLMKPLDLTLRKWVNTSRAWVSLCVCEDGRAKRSWLLPTSRLHT